MTLNFRDGKTRLTQDKLETINYELSLKQKEVDVLKSSS